MPPDSSQFKPRRRSPARLLVTGLALLTLLAAAAWFAGSFALSSYLHSEAFHSFLNRKTSAFFHANGQYMPVNWSGASFYSDGYEAIGMAHSPFSRLRADQIRAEFYPRGILHRAWQINDLQIQRLQMVFGGKRPDEAVPEEPVPLPAKSAPRKSAWIPDRLEILHAQIQQAGFEWTFPGRDGNARDLRVVIEPDGRAWTVNASGGRLSQAGCPPVNIDHLRVRYQHPVFFLTDGLLKLGDSENLGVTGQVSLEKNLPLDLRVKISGVNVTPFLPEDWRARLKGRMEGDATVTGALEESGLIQASGKLNLSASQLEALPVLDKIAMFTRTEQFRRLALQKASANFIWTPSKLTVNNLLIESEGLIRLEGECVVVNGNLDGRFQVGVTPTSLRWLPGSQERVFNREHDGFVWTEVRVSGPMSNLNEDLSPRLINAAKEQMIDDSVGTVEKGVKGVIDLINPLTR